MITINHLNKYYGKQHILKDISTVIPKGSITAVAGPNGSGKTTLMKCILGLLRYDSGEILINGNDIKISSAYKIDLGYVPQNSALPSHLSISEMVEMLLEIRNVKHSRYEELIRLLDLSGQAEKKCSALSGGTKQKAGILMGLLFRPAQLILDEPLSFLDPAASVVVKAELLRQRDAGNTVLLSSHNMHEIEEIADQLIYILDGEIHYCGTPENLMTQTCSASLETALSHLLQRQYEPNSKNLKIYRA